MPGRLARPILVATLVAGVLDIISAFVFAGMAGATPLGVLRYVASGPFGDAVREGGPGWAAIGLAVHFAIMFCMAAAYMVAGLLYGLLLWLGAAPRHALGHRQPALLALRPGWHSDRARRGAISAAAALCLTANSRRLSRGLGSVSSGNGLALRDSDHAAWGRAKLLTGDEITH